MCATYQCRFYDSISQLHRWHVSIYALAELCLRKCLSLLLTVSSNTLIRCLYWCQCTHSTTIDCTYILNAVIIFVNLKLILIFYPETLHKQFMAEEKIRQDSWSNDKRNIGYIECMGYNCNAKGFSVFFFLITYKINRSYNCYTISYYVILIKMTLFNLNVTYFFYLILL